MLGGAYVHTECIRGLRILRQQWCAVSYTARYVEHAARCQIALSEQVALDMKPQCVRSGSFVFLKIMELSFPDWPGLNRGHLEAGCTYSIPD